MKVMGEVWSLKPRSNVISKLKKLNIKDSTLGNSVAELAPFLEEVWENREVLMRERKFEFDKQDVIHREVNCLLGEMDNFCRETFNKNKSSRHSKELSS